MRESTITTSFPSPLLRQLGVRDNSAMETKSLKLKQRFRQPRAMLLRQAVLLSVVLLAAYHGYEVSSAAPAVAKTPLPSDTELNATVGRLKDKYKDEFTKAKTPQAKRELAQRFLELGEKEQADPVARYSSLMLCRDTAAGAGDLNLALASIAALQGRYRFDVLKMTADTVASTQESLQNTADQSAFVEKVTDYADEAIAAERFDIAKQLLSVALNVAGQINKPELLARITAESDAVHDYQAAFAAVREPLAVLAAKPDDPSANSRVGRFDCFIKGDWTRGLPLLAKSSDAKIKTLAEMDLKTPSNAADQTALADGWWDVAESETGVAKSQVQRRAYKWYDEASPKLTGLKRVRVDGRLKRLASVEQSSFLLGNKSKDLSSGSSTSPVIVTARWGGGNHWADVTYRVREAVGKGDTVVANPGFLQSDPTPGWRKRLQITFDRAGEVNSIDLDEGRQWSRDDYSN
jgi:hypothetical protein